MQDNRKIVGFDAEGEHLHLRTAKDKINILNEAIKVANPFAKQPIDVKKFIKGFSHYIFNEQIQSEAPDKREQIAKVDYCRLYSIPLEQLDALELQYKAIGSGMRLSDNCEYFLIPDFNIYLDNERQEKVFNALERLCKLFRYELKGLANNSEVQMTMRNLVIKDENGELTPGIQQIKRLK